MSLMRLAVPDDEGWSRVWSFAMGARRRRLRWVVGGRGEMAAAAATVGGALSAMVMPFMMVSSCGRSRSSSESLRAGGKGMMVGQCSKY